MSGFVAKLSIPGSLVVVTGVLAIGGTIIAPTMHSVDSSRKLVEPISKQFKVVVVGIFTNYLWGGRSQSPLESPSPQHILLIQATFSLNFTTLVWMFRHGDDSLTMADGVVVVQY